jgi:hypothetical protein
MVLNKPHNPQITAGEINSSFIIPERNLVIGVSSGVDILGENSGFPLLELESSSVKNFRQ